MICFPASENEPDDAGPRFRLKACVIAAAVLLALAIAVTWWLPPDVVLGAPHTDVINQFAAWRAFAADRIRAGDFPLWNPHT